ncbi:hypothetical protein BASA81_002945 [Batrachochytrium salamandrivorans]|nr:hypothetical protein BASA81_002945 [Batrachochytrium salamandrivorans]
MAEQLQYMMELQRRFSIEEADLLRMCPKLDRVTYAKMANSLFYVACRYGLPRVIAHNSKNLVDRYLVKVCVKTPSELWLLTVTAFWISVKVSSSRHYRPLEIIAERFGLSQEQLADQENKMSRPLGWDVISRCTPLHFAEAYCLRLGQIRPLLPEQLNVLMHHVMYIVDFCLLDRSAHFYSNSILACAALTLVVRHHPDADGFSFTAQDLDAAFDGADAHQLALCMDFLQTKEVPPAIADDADYSFQKYRREVMDGYVLREEQHARAGTVAPLPVVVTVAA